MERTLQRIRAGRSIFSRFFVSGTFALVLFCVLLGTNVVEANPSGKVESSAVSGESSEATIQSREAETSEIPANQVRVKNAPRPGQASGIAVEESPGASPALRWIPRAVWLVPRLVTELVFSPVRGMIWVYDRYQVKTRLEGFFFNDTGSFGVFPVLLVETGFGLNVGGRIIFRDLFGQKEGLRLRASYGGRFLQIYTVSTSSGKRFGNTKVKLSGEYAIRNQDRFFGIGNGDTVDAVPGPVDALEDDTALSSRFRQTVAALKLSVEQPIGWGWSAEFAASLRRRRFERRTDRDIADAYQLDSLVGFADGTQDVHASVGVHYDGRTHASRYQAEPAYSSGWSASGYLGYTLGIRDDPANYFRYGFDVQRYLNLYNGTRVLAMRVLGEAVTGDLDDIAFTDLPLLGGPLLLRGYDQDRFRDRLALLATAEYQWHLQDTIYGYLFADAGRVYDRWSAVTLEDLRVGYGGGIQITTQKVFLARIQLASSVDGGLFFSLSFDPVYDARASGEQR